MYYAIGAEQGVFVDKNGVKWKIEQSDITGRWSGTVVHPAPYDPVLPPRESHVAMALAIDQFANKQKKETRVTRLGYVALALTLGGAATKVLLKSKKK